VLSQAMNTPPRAQPEGRGAEGRGPEGRGVEERRAEPRGLDVRRAPPVGADPRLVYRWCERWTSTLCVLRKSFDGDLDQYLLLFVFIQSEMARSLRGLSAVARRDGFRESGPRGLNALSVAQICGVPRETTRRKLGLLVKKGYLAVHQDGLLYLTDLYRPADAVGDLGSLMDLAP
jgi:hypothetical protein